jgi:hypothetical protein
MIDCEGIAASLGYHCIGLSTRDQVPFYSTLGYKLFGDQKVTLEARMAVQLAGGDLSRLLHVTGGAPTATTGSITDARDDISPGIASVATPLQKSPSDETPPAQEDIVTTPLMLPPAAPQPPPPPMREVKHSQTPPLTWMMKTF